MGEPPSRGAAEGPEQGGGPRGEARSRRRGAWSRRHGRSREEERTRRRRRRRKRGDDRDAAVLADGGAAHVLNSKKPPQAPAKVVGLSRVSDLNVEDLLNDESSADEERPRRG